MPIIIYKRGYILVTPPATEPVSLAEVVAHCRIDGTDENTWLTAAIKQVRQQIEEITGRALITQTRELITDGFSSDEVELPFPPLISVTSINTIDNAGTESLFSDSLYTTEIYGTSAGIVKLKEGQSWPTEIKPAGGVVIRYVCGYGAASAVPEPLRLAILERVGLKYRYREGEMPANVLDGTLNTINQYKLIVM